MKHTLKRRLRQLATERPFQIAAASAVAVVLASTTGALVNAADDTPATQPASASVAELRSDTGIASRGDDRSPTTSAPETTAPSSPSASPSATKTAEATKAAKAANPDVSRKPKPPASKVLDYDYQAQTTYYYCGPAATRNALSAAGIERSQDDLAVQLGTTEMGTNSAEDTTRVLNAVVKGNPYRTRMFPNAPSPAQMDQLQADVVRAITDGRGVVANIVGDATDVDGGWHSFPGGHYIAVVGYRDEGRVVKIADSANPAIPSYWITTIDLANWMTTRGYSA
ncbi:C39 family peptidase [Micromonospora globbae]|uniref:C39 family peptidase n=1 Tax=Micromonospora globbae TaxID=1894969 RepID=UPI0034395717